MARLKDRSGAGVGVRSLADGCGDRLASESGFDSDQSPFFRLTELRSLRLYLCHHEEWKVRADGVEMVTSGDGKEW